MARFNIDQIRADNPLHEVVARAGVQLQKNGAEWQACCPFHQEKTASFQIFRGKKGCEVFFCQGCSETGDVIDFVQLYYGVDFKSACEFLGGKRELEARAPTPAAAAEIIDPYADFKVLLPPKDAPTFEVGKPTPRLFNPKRADDPKRAYVIYEPSLIHAYRNDDGRLLGYVLRVDIGEGRKITPTILWAKNDKTGFKGWTHAPMPEPRAPYGTEDLREKPELQVLIVEGEKCRDVAAATFKQFVTVSWIGGGKAAGKTNWSRLKGRRVVIWPDNDPEGEATALGWWRRDGTWMPGLAIMAIEAGAIEVKVIERPRDEKPKGWDIADAVQVDKMPPADVLAWCRDRASVVDIDIIETRKNRIAPEEKRPDPGNRATDVIRPTEQTKPDKAADDESRREGKRPVRGNVVSLHGHEIPHVALDENWRANMICNDEGKFSPRKVHNFLWMLRGHEEIRGTFAFNEMADNIFVVKRPPWDRGKGDWTQRPLRDDDITHVVAFLERNTLAPHSRQVADVLPIVAKEFSYHPIKGYLNSLKWDGVPRLRGGEFKGERVQPFTEVYFGIPATEHGGVCSRFFMRWMISAVARIMLPGSKADCMIVLESEQGRHKSTFLEVLATVNGVKYFTDAIHDIENKDAVMMLQGVWIAEIAELHSFRRKEADSVKAWLSRNTDRIRRPYGKTAEDIPRQTVVAGTMNPSGFGYLTDPTGARRFWPIPIRKPIDLDLLAAEKDQLWAEAVHLYRVDLEQWWLTEREVKLAKYYTDDRRQEDPWEFAVMEYCASKPFVTVHEVVKNMAVPVAQQTSITVKRVSEILKSSGWTRGKARVGRAGKQDVWINPDPNIAARQREFGDDAELM